LAYLYWRLKIKPNLLPSGRNDNRAPATGYWEVSRRDPNRVSITIYREPRTLSGPETGETEVRAPARNKGDNRPSQLEEDITDHAPKQLRAVGTSEIHLVPPPPPPLPPVFWTAAASITPPPPPFGPPTFIPPGPPLPPFEPPTFLPPGAAPTPLYPNPLGFGTAAAHCPPDAPPPYFHYPAPQNFQGQDPRLVNVAPAQQACAPPPARSSTPPRNNNNGTNHATPLAENQGQRRRWFSLGSRAPPVGHARTLSDSSSTVARSRSPSPRPPSTSPMTHDYGRGRPRRPSGRRPRASSPRDRETGQHPQRPRHSSHSGTRSQQHDNRRPRSESSIDSSYINTSVETVYDNQGPHAEFRRQAAHQSRSPERRGRRDSVRESRRPNSPDAIPLSNLLRQRLPTSPGPRRQPSPDFPFPSPERRRARVSFTLPGESDDVSTSSTRSSEPRRRSSARLPRRPRRDGHGGPHRQHPQDRGERGQPGLAGRVSGAFYRMRRALRGEE
ncbi:hypothetical protein C8A00DRAFT_18805, partial [Chaetomidium leptoderma]